MLELHKNRLTQLLTETASLNEFDISSYKLDGIGSEEIFMDYLGQDGISKTLFKRIMTFVENRYSDEKPSKDDKKSLLPKDLKTQLLAASKKIVAKSGTMVIAKYKGGDGNEGQPMNSYVLFDFSKPAIDYQFIIGFIWTSTFEHKIKYSPKKTLDIPNIEQIHFSCLDPKYRGQGYGKFLYDECGKHIGALLSDSTLFHGSYKLWTNHIRKSAKYFGILISPDDDIVNGDFQETRIILPIKSTDTLPTISKLNESGNNCTGFIALFGRIPAFLQKMSGIFSNVSLDDIGIIRVTLNFSGRIVSLFEEAEDMVEDIIEDSAIESHIDRYLEYDVEDKNILVWMFDNATVVTIQFESDMDFIVL